VFVFGVQLCLVMFGFGAFRELSVVCRSLDGLNVGVICLNGL
jgi:hypothetical protein